MQRATAAARTALRTPVQFGGAVLRGGGPQRQLLLDALKAGLAAVLAWVLAARVFHTQQPFLAPYTAVFMIGSVVHQSVQAAARQVAVVALGVLLAAGAAVFVPTQLGALAVVVVAGTLLGRARLLQPDGSWVALTALLLLTYGSATSEVTLLARVVDVALGAAVGVVVNTVILPPIRLRTALAALAARGGDIADLLEEAADGVQEGVDQQTPVTWAHQVWQLQRTPSASDALSDGRESLRGNPRRRSRRTGGSDDRYWPAAMALDDILPELGPILTAVGQQGDALRDGATTDALRRDLTELLRALAEAVRILGNYPANPADGATADAGHHAVTHAETMHAQAQQRHSGDPAADSDGWAVGALLMASRRSIEVVSRVQNPVKNECS